MFGSAGDVNAMLKDYGWESSVMTEHKHDLETPSSVKYY